MGPKLKAAIVAAINAYVEQSQSASLPETRLQNRWVKQGRREALNAGEVAFNRPRRWR